MILRKGMLPSDKKQSIIFLDDPDRIADLQWVSEWVGFNGTSTYSLGHYRRAWPEKQTQSPLQ